MQPDHQHTEENWRRELTPEQYHILREKGTEPPFSGALLHEERTGTYHCAACNAALFSSDAKFDSGTGWPSFDQALPGAVKARDDSSYGMHRTEIICTSCGSHIGHLFSDGPTKTGMRYCTNSTCLSFDTRTEMR